MTEEEIRRRLARFADLACWKVGLAYGSTLYFELGEKLQEQGAAPDGAIGSMSLWLYADDWRIEQAGMLVSDSESVDRQQAEGEIAARFAGARLRALSACGASVEILFSGDLRILLWRPKDSDLTPADDLVHCFFPDGQILCFNTKNRFYASREPDRFREGKWKRAHC